MTQMLLTLLAWFVHALVGLYEDAVGFPGDGESGHVTEGYAPGPVYLQVVLNVIVGQRGPRRVELPRVLVD